MERISQVSGAGMATAGVTAPGFGGSLAVAAALCAAAVSGYLILSTAATVGCPTRSECGAEDSHVSSCCLLPWHGDVRSRTDGREQNERMPRHVAAAALAGAIGCALLGAVIAYQVPVLYGGTGEESDTVGLCWICVLLYTSLLTGFGGAACLLLVFGVEAWTGVAVAWGTFLVNGSIGVVYSATAAMAFQQQGVDAGLSH
jgi:hypothetical protein